MVIAPCALAMEDLFGMSLSKSMPPGNGLCVNGKMYRRPKSTCSDEQSHRRNCSTVAMAGVRARLVESLLVMFEDATGSGKRAPIVISSLVVSPCQIVAIRRMQSSSKSQVQQLVQLVLSKKVQRHASVKIKTRLTVGWKW